MRTHERMRWSTFRVIALVTYSAGIAYDPHRGPRRVAAAARICGKSEAVARVLGLNTASVDVTSVTSTSWNARSSSPDSLELPHLDVGA